MIFKIIGEAEAAANLLCEFKIAEKNGHGPKRSIVFLHFSAEENGLIGSEFYVKNPLYDLKNTIVNLNLDMIGRIDPKRVDKNQNYIYLAKKKLVEFEQTFHDKSP